MDSGPTTCPDPYPGDASFAYNAAAAVKTSACDATDLKFFNDQIAAGNNTYKGLESSMNARKASCGQCIFTAQGDAAWGLVCDAHPCNNALQYYGACLSRAPGGSVACGKSMQSALDCIDAVCDPATCGSDAAVSACAQAVMKDKTSCGKFDFATDCGGQTNLQNLMKKCGMDAGGTFTDVISVMCGPG